MAISRLITIDNAKVVNTDQTDFPVLFRTLNSIVNTSGTALTWASGDKFNPSFIGNDILVNGVIYNVLTYTNDSTLVLGTSAGIQTGVTCLNTPYLRTTANGGDVNNVNGYDIQFYTNSVAGVYSNPPLFRSKVNLANVTYTGSNFTITEPSGAILNDILIVNITVFGTLPTTEIITAPVGWSSDFGGTTADIQNTDPSQGFRQQAFWIRRGASAPNLVFSSSAGSPYTTVSVFAYSGAIEVGNPFSFGYTAQKGNQITAYYPEVNGVTKNNNELLLYLGGTYSFGPSTVTGWTIRQDSGGGGSNDSESPLFEKLQPLLGPTGPIGNTASFSNANGACATSGILISLIPKQYSPTTKLKWDIEKYDATTGEVIAWVKLLTAYISSYTSYYITYADAGITTYQGDSVNAYDSNYVGVWHLPNGTTLSALDSTVNANNGTINGATATTGKMDGAANFSSSADITIGSSASVNLSGAFSFSVWASANVLPPTATIATIFHKLAGVDAGYELRINGTDLTILSYNGTDHGAVWTYTLTTGVLYHISGGYDGTTWYLRVNAVQRATSIDATGAISGTGTLLMGKSYGARFWDGVIDNLTLSNIYRSTNWYDTEYNNQSDTTTFYSIGEAQSFSTSRFIIGVQSMTGIQSITF